MLKARRGRGEFFYEDKGEGPVLVALRGLGRSVRHWLGFDETLSKHFRTITIDHRGVGRTTAPILPTNTMYDAARDILHLLDHLEIEQANFMGISLGGMIAMACGFEAPERCQSLCVLNSSIGGSRRMRMTPAAVRTIALGQTIKRAERHVLLADVLMGSATSAAERKRIARKFEEIDAKEPLPEWAIICQLVGASRFQVRRKLKTLDVPTLVVCGEEDRFVPNSNSRLIHSLLPDSRFMTIEGAGHELNADEGQELIYHLKNFIKETN